MRTLILALAICLCAFPAKATFVDGNLLYHHCGKPVSNAGHSICIGYISAIADAMEDEATLYGFRACVPPAAEAGQLHGQLFRYLDINPLYRHHNASTIVARFLAETYPCA